MDQKISVLLNKIANKELLLPEFQREFTWNKTQSKELIGSFLKNYPTGALLFWKTKENIALKNMPNFRFHSRIDIILDGQQRLTTLYLLIKDSIPPYYTAKDIGEGSDIRHLYYNLENRTLEYYKAIKMQNNPLWVKVTNCFKKNKINSFNIARRITENGEEAFNKSQLLDENLKKLQNITETNYPIINVEESSTLREALIVFDRVNSAGTPLSKADIALAHMCSRWPNTRRKFKTKLEELKSEGFHFDLTFLVRGMNAVINNRAEYKQLHENKQQELKSGFKKLSQILDYLVNILKNRAYIYGTDDLSTNNVLIPLIGYLSKYGPEFSSERLLRKALYWMYAALYNRRFTSSVDQKLEADLNSLRESYTPEIPPLDDLIEILKEDTGDPKVAKSNINSRSVNHPFYNMMNIVIRSKGGVDWANGLDLSKPFGAKYKVERHHIFPRSFLIKNGYNTKNLHHSRLVHEIANRVPLTKSGNMEIFDKKPSNYLVEVEEKFPGTLEKFFIPENQKLWTIDNYEDFLAKRRELIANAINDFMESLKPKNIYIINKKSLPELIEDRENDRLEFKSSLRWNLYMKDYDRNLEKPVLKTICGFLNYRGGILLIGVKDDGTVFGLNKDLSKFGNKDKYQLHLSNIITACIGNNFMPFIDIEFNEIDGKDVCKVKVEKSTKPAYYKKGNKEHFFVRLGNFTKELQLSEANEYIKENWD